MLLGAMTAVDVTGTPRYTLEFSIILRQVGLANVSWPVVLAAGASDLLGKSMSRPNSGRYEVFLVPDNRFRGFFINVIILLDLNDANHQSTDSPAACFRARQEQIAGA